MSTTKHEALALLRRSLDNGRATFREGQWEAINDLVNNRKRLIVVQRTGWGKSSVYFISAKIFRERGNGLTLIVSPLLALMRNQLVSANRLSLNAATINSTNTDDWENIISGILNDEVDILLISPERLANEDFRNRVLMSIANRIGMLVVDEVHCLSDWGHDFRPDYRRLANILLQLPENLPVVGTTATANNRVIDDICNLLGNFAIQRGPLTRSSLTLATMKAPSKAGRLAWLAENLKRIRGTGIIYTMTIRDAEQVADWLQSSGINAKAYYSNVNADGFENSNAYRMHLEHLLERNEVKAIVATSALGMGYDKPDISFVIHYQAPSSVVAYYQQVGRAGRQIESALGLLMSGNEDGAIAEYFRKTAFPKPEYVERILNVLSVNDGITATQLQRELNIPAGKFASALKFLSVESPSPVLKIESKWHRSPVDYALDVDKISRLSSQREREWQEIQNYISHKGCLMEFLANSLNDPNPRRCGKCQNCGGAKLVSSRISKDTVSSAWRQLLNSSFPLKCKIRIPKGALTKYELSGNIPIKFRPLEGRVLSRWNDPGWGQIVAEDKPAGHFRDELVDAVASMLDCWNPDPAPKWITSIPSLRKPNLVKDFCERLSRKRNIPHFQLIRKTKENSPQKEQQNGFHQCSNLDGVFVVDGRPPDLPGLLIDDVVDSGWSLTIGSVLLLRGGSGPILPVALASSNY